MTLEEIRERVAAIEAITYDDEEAHSLEDSLMRDFIQYVASSTSSPFMAELAKEVLKTRQLHFSRWCA